MQSTPITFAASLIYQLLDNTAATSLIEVTSQLHQFMKTFSQGPETCSFNQLWGLACKLLAINPGIRIIIDALDECSFEENSFPTPSSFLEQLTEGLKTTASKAIIFSRSDPRFEASMGIQLSTYMSEDFLLPDILAFAVGEYHRLELPTQEEEKTLGCVRRGSHGSFRWTGLFLDYLGRSLNMTDFRARLQITPPSVNELYKTAMFDSTSTFTQVEIECRENIILVMLSSRRILRADELGEALSLRPDRTDKIVHRLCKQLISVRCGILQWSHPSVLDFFELCHRKEDPSLGIQFSESHKPLATLCLSTLTDERYSDLGNISKFLEAEQGERAPITTAGRPPEGPSYNYASRFWDFHLAQVDMASESLLKKVGKFLHSPQFVFWAEYSRVDIGQFVNVVGAQFRLTSWLKQLNENQTRLLDMDSYAGMPYERISQVYVDTGHDGLLPWLARTRLGDIYAIMGLDVKEKCIRQAVYDGLRKKLSSEDAVFLQAKAGLAKTRLNDGRVRAARRMYTQVTCLQLRKMGPDYAQYLDTLLYEGESAYYMADFEEAAAIFTRLSAYRLNYIGPDSWHYLTAQLWLGMTALQLHQLEVSLPILEFVFKKRREQHGPKDTFASVVQVAIREVLSLLGRDSDAMANLEEPLVMRRASVALPNPLRWDIELALAKAHYAADRIHEAQSVLREIEGCISVSSHFERFCLLSHLKGLILAKTGDTDEAINLLQGVLDGIEPDQNNRALLWIRLDLADLLRLRSHESDEAQASSNFDHILKDASGDGEPGYPDEPDPPRLLALAEDALRLVRDRKATKARRILAEGQAEWFRPSDFWLWVIENTYQDIRWFLI